MEPQKYDPQRSYDWNYAHAPVPLEAAVRDTVEDAARFTFCGIPVRNPLGISAGPLLNAAWLLHYAQLGFDVLTYKTVRSRERSCYPLPNLQPVDASELVPGQTVPAAASMRGSWAISFGMPSKPPKVWREDVAQARAQLPAGKVLVVSVVASPESDWTLERIAADYAQCAAWAAEAGADCVELNFSCPNVASADGQLYQCPAQAKTVLNGVRERVPSLPCIIKIGFVQDERSARALIEACEEHASALSMVNCLSCLVSGPDGGLLFGDEPRGVGGAVIREHCVRQTALFADLIGRSNARLRLIGVGGILSAEHAREFLAAGAESVQTATGAMLNPDLGNLVSHALVAGFPAR